MRRILILGGTGDASKLATRASELEGIEVITSLAGRTRQPSTPVGTVRIGGFGGETGLANYLRDTGIELLIDATHPFAAQISFNAAAAATACGLPRLMLVRPAWQPACGDRWIEVESVEAAAATLRGQAKRVFLTIGRQQLTAFADLDELWFLMRLIDPPELGALVPEGMLLFERGPFSLAEERQLLRQHAIDAVVSKNSGGEATYAKIVAARELGLKVVMVKRPAVPPGEQVANVDNALAWLVSWLG